MTRTHLVLSPHADDAVWSVGGRMARWIRRGNRVTVLTVFDGAGTMPARDWRAVAEPETRKRENIAALEVLGARNVSVGLPEAALRGDGDTPRYGKPRSVFGPVHERDRMLLAAVVDAVSAELGPNVLVHAPLAAGRHVDHVLTRRVAELLGLRAMLYFEDFPYRLRERDHQGLRCDHAPVDLEVWLRAAREYSSQITALFGSMEAFEAALHHRACTHGHTIPWRHADRFWYVEQTFRFDRKSGAGLLRNSRWHPYVSHATRNSARREGLLCREHYSETT